MAESRAFARRVFLEDRRHDGSYLRVTWHPEQRAFVLSHWREDVCLASTQLDAADVAPLLGLLGHGLADAAATPVPAAAPAAPASLLRARWIERLVAAAARRRPGSDATLLSFPNRERPAVTDEPKWKSGG